MSRAEISSNRKVVRSVFSKKRASVIEEVASEMGVRVSVTTKPGEQYRTDDGYEYPLSEDMCGLQIDATSDLSDFWEKVELSTE